MKQVSIYNGVTDRKGVIAPIEAVIDRIRTGANGLAEKTRLLNVLFLTDRDAYEKEKEKLPAVTWAGTFPKGKRQAEHLLEHSGYIVMDIDNDIDLPAVLADLAQHPNVAIAFVSPSAHGAKAVIPVDPIPQNAAEHRAAFQAVLEVFSEYAEQDPEKLPKQRNPNRLCFLACDPRIIVNPNWKPVAFDPADADTELSTSEATPFDIEMAVDDYLKKHGITFKDTLVIRKNKEVKVNASGYFPKALCPTEHKSNNKAVTFFHNDDGSITGFCNGCQKHWYLQQPTAPRKRYQIHTEHQHATSDMDTQRKANQNTVTRWLTETESLPLKADWDTALETEKDIAAVRKVHKDDWNAAIENQQHVKQANYRSRSDAAREAREQANAEKDTARRKYEALAPEAVAIKREKDTAREAYKERVAPKHLLILASDAGTGKTTITTTTAETLLYISKTTEEADTVYEALCARGKDAHRHRPRLFNRGAENWDTLPLGLQENDRPCIHPETCNALASKGHASQLFCERQCSLYKACAQDGYLSQTEIEQRKQVVVYAWGEDVACDEVNAARVERIAGQDAVLIVDEVNPLGLSQRRELGRSTLYDLAERFRHPTPDTVGTYQQIKALLDHQSTAETPEAFITGVRDWMARIEDLEALDEKCEAFPLGVVFQEASPDAAHGEPFEACLCYQDKNVTVPVVDYETADDTPVYFRHADAPIETEVYRAQFVSYSFLVKVGLASFDDPPRQHRRIFSDLKRFLDENRNIETAPFAFDPKQQTFEFHLKPTLNHRRVIFLTASDPDDLISEAYRDTSVTIARHTGAPPAWKSDNVFQIASGAYLPRQSLIRSEGDTLHLKERAADLVESYIKPSIHAGLKVLVVAPKAFQSIARVLEWAVTEMDDWTERKALLINHHHAEGRNDFQDFDIVFVFHYEPNHNEIPLQAKQVYRNPDTPLSFDRAEQTVTVGGVSFKKNVYTDARVQAVYNRECRARLMQSAMRLRPNLHAGKKIVFFTAEPVDIPVTPIPFTPADAKHFTGDWTEFRESLNQIAQATENGDVQAYTEATGQSQRTAERKTKAVREQQKADRDAEILRLHQLGNSHRAIHTAMTTAGYKVSLGTIGKVLRDRAKNDNPLLYNTNSDLSQSARLETEPVTVSVQPTAEGHTASLVEVETETGEPLTVTILHRPPPQHVPNIEQDTERSIEDDILEMYHAGKSARRIATELFLPIDDIQAVIDAQDF